MSNVPVPVGPVDDSHLHADDEPCVCGAEDGEPCEQGCPYEGDDG